MPLWSILPALYLLACVLAMSMRQHVWWVARSATVAGLMTAVALGTGSLVQARFVLERVDTIGWVTATLVALLGWVIVRFSHRYLEGESGQARYVAALLFTFASVGTLILTHNLLVLALAWTASSLSLHHLLTFHAERAQAQIVAHKKFLASRMAETCLLFALLLIYRATGTMELEGLSAFVAHATSLPPSFHLAAVLIALAAILKSAQLPVHGWLIQVMEAPTPVSALQHAGVVNIGGFVLIRLAPLIAATPTARVILVVVGTLTAALAGLVMMTRISIKVRLAWSTCAQMGFMLMECGLGLYELALLHLVAHSLYKAHAFLSSGDTVLDARRHDLAPTWPAKPAHRTVLYRLIGLPISLGLVEGSAIAWKAWWPGLNLPVVAIAIVGLGLAPLLWGAAEHPKQSLARGVVRILMLTQLYVFWHLVFGRLVPESGGPSLPLALWVGVCFAALYVVQIWLLAYPRGAIATKLFHWTYAGFYLDERFTRLTFRIWPAKVTAPPTTGGALPRPVMNGRPV
ncbi:MAG TPA: NADH-quinone oxidoreductase subunit L [Stenomitos sp.]